MTVLTLQQTHQPTEVCISYVRLLEWDVFLGSRHVHAGMRAYASQ
jgi:hypothetical protein